MPIPNFRHTLPLEFSASIDHNAGVWTGEARIPADYFPPNVTLFNAYAIHGTGEDRAYEALYESSGPQADFHRSIWIKAYKDCLFIDNNLNVMTFSFDANPNTIFQIGEISTN